jgi:hypothetical protein
MRLPSLVFAPLALATACSPEPEAAAVVDPTVAPIEDTTMEGAITDALRWALSADLTAPWRGLAAANAYGDGACPAGHSGEPPDNDLPGTGAVGSGTSWTGSCAAGDVDYLGYMYWETAFTGDLSAGAARMLIGDSTVGQGDTVLYEFDGNANDRYTESVTWDGLSIWEYESEVDATITGSLAYGADSEPGAAGIQEDLFVYYGGGDIQTLEAYGNVYLYEGLLADSFDSVFLDVEMDGRGADPDTCTAEPRGTIGLRDHDANWYYVQFAPKYNSTLDYENAPYSTCDGCGTAYFNGFEQASLLCPDFTSLLGGLVPPDASEFPL